MAGELEALERVVEQGWVHLQPKSSLNRLPGRAWSHSFWSQQTISESASLQVKPPPTFSSWWILWTVQPEVMLLGCSSLEQFTDQVKASKVPIIVDGRECAAMLLILRSAMIWPRASLRSFMSQAEEYRCKYIGVMSADSVGLLVQEPNTPDYELYLTDKMMQLGTEGLPGLTFFPLDAKDETGQRYRLRREINHERPPFI
ncbi:hypothetical protein WJX75_006378 [Coccomyxa subellipsoidea]|uniref:Uncharacterized protein n=1 Tax=Coccomyxa subellipsoidea TaxID=248742 RepID=A0ABR2YED4_9CHLO